MSSKSVFGLNENIAGALSYVLGFFSGIVIYILERDNKFVRFHALQSTVTFLILALATTVLGWIPIFGGLFENVLGILTAVVYVYMIFTAYTGKTFKLPIIGDIVWEQVNK